MGRSLQSPFTPNLEFLPLWERLRGHGHLWHRTSLPCLESILHDRKIVPNKGQFPNTYPQSQGSYGRHLGAVSLFDFDSESEPSVLQHVHDFGFNGVLIRIQRDALERANLMLPNEISHRDHPIDTLSADIVQGCTFIPAVEALHIGSIPTSAFSGFILIAFNEHGRYLWREVGVDADAFHILSEISVLWNADHKRLTAERHARGEFTLTEVVEASYNL